MTRISLTVQTHRMPLEYNACEHKTQEQAAISASTRRFWAYAPRLIDVCMGASPVSASIGVKTESFHLTLYRLSASARGRLVVLDHFLPTCVVAVHVLSLCLVHRRGTEIFQFAPDDAIFVVRLSSLPGGARSVRLFLCRIGCRYDFGELCCACEIYGYATLSEKLQPRICGL
jgi:hypothetical protein